MEGNKPFFKEIFEESAQVEEIFSDIYANIDNDDFDADAAKDTIEGVQLPLIEKCKGYHGYGQRLMAEANPYKERAQALLKRAKALESLAKFIDSVVFNAMKTGKIDHIQTSYGDLKIVNCPKSVEILDSKSVPDNLRFAPKEPEPSKAKIKKYIEEHGDQPFAKIVQNKRLSFK
jgi:hypothetical protein